MVLDPNHMTEMYEHLQTSLVAAYLDHKKPERARAVIEGILDSKLSYTPTTPGWIFGDVKLKKISNLLSAVHKHFLENGNEKEALKVQKEMESLASELRKGEVISSKINYSNVIEALACNFQEMGMEDEASRLLESHSILHDQKERIAGERLRRLARLGVADEELEFRSDNFQDIESVVICLIDGEHYDRVDTYIEKLRTITPADRWNPDFCMHVAKAYIAMDRTPDAIDILEPLTRNFRFGFYNKYLLSTLHTLYERQRAVELDSLVAHVEQLGWEPLKEEFKQLLGTKQFETFDQCKELFNVSPAVIAEIVDETVADEGARLLTGDSKSSLTELINHFSISPEVMNDALCLPRDTSRENPDLKAQTTFISNAQNSKDPTKYVDFVMKDLGYQFDRYEVVRSLSDKCTDYFESEPKHYAFGSYVKESMAAQRRASGPVRFTQWHVIEDLVPENGKKWDEALCQEVWERLKVSPQWLANPEAVNGFECGARYFGYKAMLKYSSAADVSLHDIFYAMPTIVLMAKTFAEYRGFTPGDPQFNIKQAFSRILEQTTADNAGYEEGSSYQHLNAYAFSSSSILPNALLQMVLTDSVRGSDGQLVQLVQSFQVPENILGSWSSLRKYLDFCYIFENENELLSKLYLMEQEASRLEGSETPEHKIAKAKADFFRTILYHPGGKVSAQALVELFNSPYEFLVRDDSDSHGEAHEKKKPSNYIEIPHLGLSADDLVNALVSGAMDKLQVLPSASYLYSLSKPGCISRRELEKADTRKVILLALGSRERNIRGILSQSGRKALFKQLNDVVKHADSENKKDLNGFIAEEFELSSAQTQSLHSLVTDSLIREGKLVDDEQEYVVSIHKKSSPIAVLAGNDTVCCMPFGSGKSNIYMFNPNCVQLTVQEVTNIDGEYVAGRTVAQSIVTLNINAKQRVPQLLKDLDEHGHLYKIIDEDLLAEQERYLACDSIEHHENSFSSEDDAIKLQQVFEDFFYRYLGALPNTLEDGHNLNSKQVLVSNTYGGPFVKSLDKVSNTYVPLAPMAYSDMLSDRARLLKPTSHNGVRVDEVEVPYSDGGVTKETITGRVSNLTYRDSLQVAYLEGKIYCDLESIITNLENIENGLIAKDIANSYRQAPELSLKYIDRSGRMRAYLYAYEGRVDYEDSHYLDLPEGSSLVYISDFASLRPNSLEAGKLLLEFLDRYKQAYLADGAEGGESPPIFFSARATTSHKLIEKQVKNISKRLGRDVEMVELDSDSSSGEQFNDVLLLIN